MEYMDKLVVSPELTIEKPEKKLLAFLRSEWLLYDGQPVSQDSQLELFDILVSIMTNSRLDTARKVWSVWNGRTEIEDALSEVPADIALTDPEIPWEKLGRLFDVFCGIKYAKEAVTTKVLHKKRPDLIPILDSVTCKHLHDCAGNPVPRGASRGVYLVEYMKRFREQLLGCLPQITDLCGLAASLGMPITRIRALEILMWVELEPSGRYREQADTDSDF